jgi:thiosulfate dehydrogenase
MLTIRILAAATVGSVLLMPGGHSVGAAEAPLEMAVATGAHLFATATFGGNGRTCESCHQEGGETAGQLGGRKLPSLLNAAAIYPRFSRRAGQVVTLEGQVQSCIKGGLNGTPPELGSPDLIALTAYLGSIAKGQQVEIGGAPK